MNPKYGRNAFGWDSLLKHCWGSCLGSEVTSLINFFHPPFLASFTKDTGSAVGLLQCPICGTEISASKVSSCLWQVAFVCHVGRLYIKIGLWKWARKLLQVGNRRRSCGLVNKPGWSILVASLVAWKGVDLLDGCYLTCVLALFQLGRLWSLLVDTLVGML